MARDFGGSSSARVTINNPPFLPKTQTAPRSYTAWVRGAGGSGTKPRVISTNAASLTGAGGFEIAIDSARNIDIYDGAWKTMGVLPDSTNWHHIALTFDGMTIRLYIDGILDNSVASSGRDSEDIFMIGARAQFGSEGYAGDIAEVTYFSRKLEDEEIRRIYLFGPVGIPGIDVWLPLRGFTDPEPDMSRNGLQGTVSTATQTDHPPISSRGYQKKPPTYYRNTISGTAKNLIRTINETIQITEDKLRNITIKKTIDETENITENTHKMKGLSRQTSESINIF